MAITAFISFPSTKGFTAKEYKWKGNLPLFAAEEVTLPGIIEGNEGVNHFIASLIKPDGKNDEDNSDNTFNSTFIKATAIENEFIIFMQTNNQPRQNEYYIVNSAGDTLFKRAYMSLKPATIYRDTLKLTAGAYNFVVKDSAGDGLEFWYNTEGGRGRVFLLTKNGQLLKSFDSDFGNEIFYSFYVDDKAVNKISGEPVMGLFPTMTLGKTTFDYFLGTSKDVDVQITTEDGKIVEEHKYISFKEGVMNYDLSYRPPQRYYFKVYIDGQLKFTKRIRVVNKL